MSASSQTIRAARPRKASPLLRCPSCASLLPEAARDESGAESLRCGCGQSYAVRGGIPRFVESEGYAESFGVEWKEFPRTQLDSANGTSISRYRFTQLAGCEPEALAGRRVLEVGCGMGRFLDLLAEAGAEVWGVDLSSAIEVAAENLVRHPNCRLLQADLFRLPFGEDFDFIYSFGVLHHTPDPRAALHAVARHLRPGGRLAVWVYGRGVSTGITSRWVPRPHNLYGALFRRLPLPARRRALALYTRCALGAGSVPLLGNALRHVLPVQDLRRKGPRQDGYDPLDAGFEKRERLRSEWAMHSAFDMFTPAHVAQHDAEEVMAWARDAGLVRVETGEAPVTVRAERPEPAASVHAGRSESGEKVSVLFFASRLGGGGAEMHLLRVMNHLDRRRFRVSLAVTRPAGPLMSALAADVKLHVLPTGGRDSTTLRMARAVMPLRRLIRQERPDIVCSMMDQANIVNVLASRGVNPRPKVVLGVQTPPSIAFSFRWHPVGRMTLALIPRLYPRADRIITLSKGVAGDLAALSPRAEERITTIYNAGVEESVMERASEPLAEGERPAGVPLIVACGRLKALKGFKYLIDALALVRQRVPAELWIVGEGEERANLERQAARLGLGDSVRLLGFQSNPFKYMAAADLFVLSSLFEGFGNVIVEAMACGAPVVAADCPYGPAEIISDGETGLLVPPADAGRLAEAILRVLTDEPLRERLRRAGAERARDFHAERIAAAYGDELRSLVSGSAQGTNVGGGG
jgi:glycosyltransferase involved in cell wall biosynthesis/SAM-dependent methyltransferase